ncbi:MAG: alanine--tRNA ligase [Actinomycetota bacterium]|nr:alanine--tRNA ligase [Actinomycetota bacterium]
MRTSDELREGFLAYFASKGHARRRSGSLVPATYDPSVLLTTAGMQPLKPYFLGLEEPPSRRLATVQKCFRTTDIDDVGLNGRTLTFFEMLGNFSIGDYFKDGAVDLAWEFVTEHLRFSPDLLWATVFAGDPELGLDRDDVAAAAWERVGVPPERIVGLPRSENFWQAGPSGPCGPCSELYHDQGPERGCGRPDCAPGCSCDRFLEFWNLVFMEFDLHEDGRLTPLPSQNIDTGLGVERGAALLQRVSSVYETDAYRPIIEWIEGETGTRYGESEEATKSYRVLADHGRGMAFLVADGVTPSNEGRGYVLRRIARRAIQHGSRIGLETPFLARLADVVVERMSGVYAELAENAAHIRAVLSAEEERFARTLANGMRLFEEVAERGAISGEDAFRLHDTYGFPIEMTRELARERGLAVDEEEFTKLMAEQRKRSRAVDGGVPALERAAEFARAAGFETEFVGYEKTDVLTQLGAVEPLGDGTFLAKLRESPFYAESGGQVTDAGWIERLEGNVSASPGAGEPRRAELAAAHRFGDDQALLFKGEGFEAGDRVRAVVPWGIRFPTMANHTATHLLHEALRRVLGTHVQQAGSAVRPDKLRFDFTHSHALTPEERERVEELVNERIFEGLPVHAFVTPIGEARTLGAQMLFGEKYGDVVRVIEIGSGDAAFSRELCGGTHVRSTAEISLFAILSEGSVGAGARRIEAVTSGEAYAYLRSLAAKAEELREELERARREGKRKARAGGPDIVAERRNRAGDVEVIVVEALAADADELLQLSDRLMQQHPPAAVVLGSRVDGRVHLVVNLDRSLEARGLDAVEVVRHAAALVGGGGGGRPTMARAGGRVPEKLGEALQAAERALMAALS